MSTGVEVRNSNEGNDTVATPSKLGPNERLIGVAGSRYALSTPALVIDLDLLEANISSMAAHASAHGYNLRPVTKIHKSSAITRLQSAAGAIGTCCSTLAEAEVMVDAGISGVLLYSSVVSAAKIERVALLNARAEGFIVAVDDHDNANALAEAARRSGRPLQVLVDLEVGGRRTGVATREAAVALATAIEANDDLVYAGVQGYCGAHQATVDFERRRDLNIAVMDRLSHFVEALKAAQLPPIVVSGGGTGTHDIDAEYGLLTEVQAGSYVFMDGHYHNAVLRRGEAHPFSQVLTVHCNVISNGQTGFVMTDAGSKEIDFIHNGIPIIVSGGPQDALYSKAGDDLGRIEFRQDDDRLNIGDTIELMPPHAYQTAAMYPYYHCVRGDELVDIWPIDALAND